MFYPPITMKQNYFFAFVWQDNKTNNSFLEYELSTLKMIKKEKISKNFLPKRLIIFILYKTNGVMNMIILKLNPSLKYPNKRLKKLKSIYKEKEKLLQINKHLKDFPKP